jgi:hypothetical protein
MLHLVGFFFMNFTMMQGSTNIKWGKEVTVHAMKVHGAVAL